MIKLLRLASMMATLLFVALVAALLQREWACDLGVEQWSLTGLAHAPSCDQGEPLLPSPETKAVDRRIAAKQRVVNELLNGRHTLFETAAIFRRLNDEYPKPPPYPYIPGDTDEERACWQVIIWAQGALRLRGYPEGKIVEVSAYFERELRDHKLQHGTVCLPDVMDTQ